MSSTDQKQSKKLPKDEAAILMRRVLAAYLLDFDATWKGNPDTEQAEQICRDGLNYVRLVDWTGKHLALYRVRHGDPDGHDLKFKRMSDDHLPPWAKEK